MGDDNEEEEEECGVVGRSDFLVITFDDAMLCLISLFSNMMIIIIKIILINKKLRGVRRPPSFHFISVSAAK